MRPNQLPNLSRCIHGGSVICATEGVCGQGAGDDVGKSQTRFHFERQQVRRISLPGKALYDAQESAFGSTQPAQLVNDVENTHLVWALNFLRRLAKAHSIFHAVISLMGRVNQPQN